MEKLVELLLTVLGAPGAVIASLVGATIFAGLAHKCYKEAKESAARHGRSITDEIWLYIAIVPAIGALSGVWTAIEVLMAYS